MKNCDIYNTYEEIIETLEAHPTIKISSDKEYLHRCLTMPLKDFYSGSEFSFFEEPFDEENFYANKAKELISKSKKILQKMQNNIIDYYKQF